MAGGTPTTRYAEGVAKQALMQSLIQLHDRGMFGNGNMTPAQREQVMNIASYNVRSAQTKAMAGASAKDILAGITIDIPGSDFSQASQDAAAGATDLEKMRKQMQQSYGFSMQTSRSSMPVYESNQQLLASGSLLGLGGAANG